VSAGGTAEQGWFSRKCDQVRADQSKMLAQGAANMRTLLSGCGGSGAGRLATSRAAQLRGASLPFSSSPAKPLVAVCILDGWGYRETSADNAVVQAHTPNYDGLFGRHAQLGQVSFLDACEREVGLPEGQIGNSEVGHMNIGAGRVVYQDICTIDNAIEDGSLREMDALVQHIDKLKASGGVCHVMGLVSPGGVHAMQSHVATLANIVAGSGVPVVVHAFTDGRDVPPSDAISTIPDFVDGLDEGVTIGTVTGRYYSMDRDNRWERVSTAYDVIVSAQGVAPGADSAMDAIKQAYNDNLTDEFINPTVIGDYRQSHLLGQVSLFLHPSLYIPRLISPLLTQL
jgi:2,3-bisphosphoglycerate-independent phosphoglycerate mutase